MGTDRLSDALARLENIGNVLREEAEPSEARGFLTDRAVDAIRDAGLFRLLWPTGLGGLALTFPESVAVYAAVAAIDASIGWTVTLLNNGALFSRYVDPDVVTDILERRGGLVAGSLNPLAARAEPAAGGYVFTGKAPYASGCHHADWVVVAALVHRDGKPSFVDGGPELVAGFVPMSSAVIERTWAPTGMRATGSDDCRIDGVFVDERLTFAWRDPIARRDEPVWPHIPMVVQFGGGLAANLVGAARGSRDAFVELARTKRPAASLALLSEQPHVQVLLGEAEGLLHAAEDTLAAGVASVWSQGMREEPFTDADRARMRIRAVTAGQLACRAVDRIHQLAGMSAVRSGSHLERAWRDVHTATQHVMVGVNRYDVVGRIALGLGAGSPVI